MTAGELFRFLGAVVGIGIILLVTAKYYIKSYRSSEKYDRFNRHYKWMLPSMFVAFVVLTVLVLEHYVPE